LKLVKAVIFMLLFSLVLSVTVPLWAAYPERPIKVINQNKEGGPSDVEVRGLQPYWEEELGQSIYQEYITAGGGKLAARTAYKAAPDGYTLYYINMPAANVGEVVYEAPYKVLDFTFLQNLVVEFRTLVVLADSNIKTIDDLIKTAKSKELTIAHSGLGGSSHLQTLLVKNKLGIPLRDVPFDGAAPAQAAFLGGHVDLWTPDASVAYSLAKSGNIRVLAVHASERLPLFPDVPTFKELSYEGMEIFTARGFVAPPGLDPKIRSFLIETLHKASTKPEFMAWAEKVGKSLRVVSGDEYRKMAEEVQAMVTELAPFVKESIAPK